MAETAVVLDAEGKPVVEKEVVVVPPVVEKPKAPVYDEAQQAHFDATINAAYGKAFEKASGIFGPQIKELNDKLAALAEKPVVVPPVKKDEEVVVPPVGQSKAVTDELARLNALVAETKGIAETNKKLADDAAAKLAKSDVQSRDTRIKEEFFKAADKHDFFDRSDIFNLVKNDFSIDDASNEVVVIHPGTKLPRQNSSLKNMSIEEFISDFAKTKPHMVRSTTVEGGTGASGAKKLETTKTDDKPDYAGMPTDKFLDLAQKVIADGYKTR